MFRAEARKLNLLSAERTNIRTVHMYMSGHRRWMYLNESLRYTCKRKKNEFLVFVPVIYVVYVILLLEGIVDEKLDEAGLASFDDVILELG